MYHPYQNHTVKRLPAFKHPVFTLHIVIVILAFPFRNEAYNNKLFIDPGDIADSLLPILLQDDSNKISLFEKSVAENSTSKFDGENYFDIIFRYRDASLLPVFNTIATTEDTHPFFRISAIYVIGETGSEKDLQRLFELWQREKNELVREYIASAIGKIAGVSAIPLLNQMFTKESNEYVRKTLTASINRARGNRRIKIAYLPLYDTTGYRRLKTFPSESPQTEFGLIARKKIDISLSHYIPLAKDCIFPHMQYKMCQSVYDKVNQPFTSFALEGVSHVGEDSGWLFEGMPVHSIMDGRVVLFQHEESWGCLVCIESQLEDRSTVCTYYGHLSGNLDVYVGKIVKKGDKIGEIGPSFSFQNGGYRSHLHLGIEKAPIGNAVIAGYSEDVEHWYNPVDFIKRYGRETIAK